MIGSARSCWARTGAHVDITAPVVYRRIAHTRYRGQVLLQLVYSVWLPARPNTSTLDLLGGHLDGVIWRVTLGPDGLRSCTTASITAGAITSSSPPPVRSRCLARTRSTSRPSYRSVCPRWRTGSRIKVRLESGTHYIQRVLVAGGTNGVSYAFAADDRLRSLPLPAGDRRSAFRTDGIVAGSERDERYLFWPMGVREPGAMRQWGRHATAFIGRRQFDEARLMERYFTLRLD